MIQRRIKPAPAKSSINIGLPLAMGVMAASVVLMAIMLLVNDKGDGRDGGNYDVENYDVVGNMPFIFGAGE